MTVDPWVLLFGALGGLVNTIVTNKGSVVFPRFYRDEQDKRLKLRDARSNGGRIVKVMNAETKPGVEERLADAALDLQVLSLQLKRAQRLQEYMTTPRISLVDVVRRAWDRVSAARGKSKALQDTVVDLADKGMTATGGTTTTTPQQQPSK